MLQTKAGRFIDVEILVGNEVYELLHSVSPDLANLINYHTFQKDDFFFKVSYPFGAKIIHNNEVFLPLIDGGSISFNDPALPDILSDNLGYTTGISNPVGIILSKESEFYKLVGKRILPYQIIKPGQIFGFSHIANSVMRNSSETEKKAIVSPWSLDAGARSAFLLAKISNLENHTNLLNAYKINCEKPVNYMQHCPIFRAISASTGAQWKQDIVFFSAKFIERLRTNPAYAELYKQLAGIHRLSYDIWHYSIRNWESEINEVIYTTGLGAYASYSKNLAKHVLLIAARGAPGFAPAKDDRLLPKTQIETAYTTGGYGLTQYCPTIMQPAQFSIEKKLSVYYSLGLPTLFDYSPETFKGKSNINLLCEIATILNRAQKYILKNFKNKGSELYETVTKTKFSFYHNDPDPEKFSDKIKDSALLPEEDPRFISGSGLFPSHSHFTHSCIKIEPA